MENTLESNVSLNENITSADTELELMLSIHKILHPLKNEPETLNRILEWVCSKYLTSSIGQKPLIKHQSAVSKSKPDIQNDEALNRLAVISKDGSFQFTCRDLKAKTQIDAVKRLVYAVTYLNNDLSGSDTTSRKKILNPILEKWRLFNGNTRFFISNDPGIIKSGDELSLDIHASEEAQVFIKEMLDPSLTGSWKPGTKKAVKKSSNINTEKED